MAVAVFKASYHGNDRLEVVKQKHTTGRRRVFVQTESGCVLGMDLDRNDNAHMVKRRLQIAFNVPIEESCLTFGDMVLKNDLTAIRNDSPLLLTRNLFHRSSSTPCLSVRDSQQQQHKDQSGPIEILSHSSNFSRSKDIVNEIVNALKIGVEPIPVHGGLGGAYFFRNSNGESVAIVKPTDEEPFAPNNPKGFVGKALGKPGLKRSIRVGETGFREVAAYLLDHDHFANVPPTALVKITHSIFNVNERWKKGHFSKIASLQQFIRHDFDASDHGTSSFPVSAVHRIGILDIRIFNTDRHAGNLLVRKVDDDVENGKFGEVELIPIDHGLCLPESLEDPYFEWIHWPQASIPFSEDEIEYVEALDPFRDSEMLRNEVPMIREACLRVLILCTVFLKEAVRCGLCLGEIGEMMSREFRRGEEEPSELEVVCMEARRIVIENENKDLFVLSPKTQVQEDGFLFEMDPHDSGFEISGVVPLNFGFGRNPLSKLVEEEDDDDGEKLSNLSMTLKKSLSVGCDYGGKGYVGVKSSGGQRSAGELVPAGGSFVKVAEMEEEEWGVFLEKFLEVVKPALVRRKSRRLQRNRLGSSCRF